jgi:sialate O-acetylesterase
MKPIRIIFALALAATSSVALSAQTTLPEIFRDHMILQRQQPIPVWGRANAGAAITVRLADAQQTTTADKDGKWRVQLPAREAGGPFILTVSAGSKTINIQDVLLGDIWLASGQSNMTMPMRSNMPWSMGVLDYEHEIASANEKNVRFYLVPKEPDYPEQTEMHGIWRVSVGSQVCDVSAASYYFARKLNHDTNIPIGVIVSGNGATGIESWVNMDVNRKYHPKKMEELDKLLHDHASELAEYERSRPGFEKQQNEYSNGCTSEKPHEQKPPIERFIFRQSALYNAMIYPFHQVPIKGAIWYQGENDSGNYKEYANEIQDLIASWRASWHEPNMPFYMVQLENVENDARRGLDPDPTRLHFTNFREMQRRTVQLVPHTGIAVSADVGDPYFPHPRNKRPVGERLALLAEANDYGLKVVASGPVLKSFSRSGDKLLLKFDAQGGPLIVNTGTIPYGFEIAGADKVYHPAVSAVDGDTVTLNSPLVKEPLNARYGWRENPYLSLYNTADLPASPFATDWQP